MRRIYESDALHRDDTDAFSPREEEMARTGTRSINWGAASHALMPNAVRRRAIEVTVETDKDVYRRDEEVLIRVMFRNKLPLPVSLPVPTQLRWTWSVGGVEAASAVGERVPQEPALFRFERGQRRVFHRQWSQRIREDDQTWTPAEPGDHEIVAWIATDPVRDDLRAQTTIRIEP